MQQLAEQPAEQSGIGLLMTYVTTVLNPKDAEQFRDQLAELAPAAEKAMESFAESLELSRKV